MNLSNFKPLAFAASFISFTLLSLVTGYSQEIDWTLVYDGKTLPTQAGAIQYANGQSGAFSYNSSAGLNNLNLSIVDSNYLRFNPTGAGWLLLDTNQDERLFLNSTTGYTVEYRARFIANHAGSDNISGASIDFNDGRSGVNAFWQLGFGVNADQDPYVQLRAGTNSNMIAIGTDWITYTVTVVDNQASLYMDGVHIATTNLRANIDSTQSRWGNVSGSALKTEFEVDYLKIYDQGAIIPIPEPGTTVLLAGIIAISVLVLRRQRSH